MFDFPKYTHGLTICLQNCPNYFFQNHFNGVFLNPRTAVFRVVLLT